MIVNPSNIKKHLQFRAPYTPATLNEVREQIMNFNGRLHGMEVVDKPLTVPASVLVKTGAFVTQDRIVVQLLSDTTIAVPSLAAPFALVARTDDELSGTNTEILFVEDQLIQSSDAVLAVIDELGLLSHTQGNALGELAQDVRGGLVDRRTITATSSQVDFDTRTLCYSPIKGSDLLVFQAGKKLAFNFFGANPAVGWIQAAGGITYVGATPVVAGEKWDFILDRSIKFQERFTGDGSNRVFDLTLGTYKTGVGQTMVFIDGVYQVRDVDYQETDTDTITFFSSTTPTLDAEVEVVITTGVHVFENILTAFTGQSRLDLTNRMQLGGNAILLFKNGSLLRRIDDYTDLGCERIFLTTPAVYGDEFTVYELRTTGQTVGAILNRQFRELDDITQILSDAVIDPGDTRVTAPSSANVFITSDEIDARITAGIPSLGDIASEFRVPTTFDFTAFGDVNTDTDTDPTEGEVYLVVTNNTAGVESVIANVGFRMKTAILNQIVIPFKFTSNDSGNDAVVTIKDFDGTTLATFDVRVELASLPLVRTEITIPKSSFSTQPTGRFTVNILISLKDSGETARVGGVDARYE